MRFAFGLIVGVILTIGAAYLSDTLSTAPGPDQKDGPHMVNWSVVNDNLKGLSSSVQNGWNRLTGHTNPA